LAEGSISRLVTVLGGAREVADSINALIDKHQVKSQRHLSARTVYDWTRERFPFSWRVWVLILALDRGLIINEIVALCPEMQEAVSAALLLRQRRKGE
jgi:hypothetical protein